jgi:WD40 repeat protein/serine/threonine protein kinase
MSSSSRLSNSTMLIDQRRRWQRGDHVLVEKLIEERPCLRNQGEPILELLYQEMLLREESGQPAQVEEFLRRFPQFAGELKLQFEVHAALTSGGEDAKPDQARKGTAKSRPEIDGYELLGELGHGGMGVVYKARQTRLNRIVALKMIRSGRFAGSHELVRFRREAEVVAQLQHPNIVQIHEVGEADGWPYLALEFVDGTSLDRVLAGKPQPVEDAARLVEALARAMHYAHVRGIVHRDLKPANVLLGSMAGSRDSAIPAPSASPKTPPVGGSNRESRKHSSNRIASALAPELAKITDFGLAKSLEPGPPGATKTGDILGTPSYMAPEQAGGKPEDVSFAADIYSLGAILYELLTGLPPFTAESTVETLLLVQTREPTSPARLRPGLPRDLVTICLTCLHKQPGRRYATALDMADDLRRFLNHEPILARPTGRLERSAKWARRHPAAATLVATIILVATLGLAFVSWQLKQTAAALADARRANAESAAQDYLNRIALAHHELLAHHVGQAESLLAECPPEQRGWEWHYLNRRCRTDLMTMSGHSREARALAYSPDGRWIASGSGSWFVEANDGEVKLWDARTGKELRTLARQIGTVFTVDFSPDSRLLASAGRAGKIVLWNPETHERIRELRGNRSAILHVAFSPDGRKIVSAGADVRIWDVESGNCLHTLKKHQSTIWSAAWSPDGRRVVSTDWKGEAHLWDAEKGEHMRLLVDAVDLRVSAFSPDGALLTVGSWDGSLLTWRLKQLDAPPHIRNPNMGQLYGLAYSPDARRLACGARDGTKIIDVASGAELLSVAGHNGVAVSLAYSPDGARIATGGMDGTVKVWDATASEEFRRNLEVNSVQRAFTVDSQGRSLSLGFQGRAARMVDVASAKPIVSIPDQATPLSSMAADTAGRWLAWVGSDNVLKCWDRRLETMAWTQPIADRPVTGLAISADGEWLAWGGPDGIAHWCTASSGKPIAELGERGSSLTGVAFHPLRNFLATINQDGVFLVWDLAARRVVSRFGSPGRDSLSASSRQEDLQRPAAPRIVRLAYSPDGMRLVCATRLRPPEIWDVTTGKLALILDRAVDGADCAGFSADGRQLIAGIGGQMRFWNTADLTRAERLTLAEGRELAWHRREANASRQQGHWFGREFHIRYLLAAEPQVASHHENYATALGYLGKWDEALAANNKAIELGSRSLAGWYNRVCLALRSENVEEYQQACVGAQEKIAVADDPEIANFQAWIGVVSPRASGDPLRCVELAEMALQKKPGHYAYLNTYGAALYRAGRYVEAIDQLLRGIQAHEKKAGIGIDWALLAMAHAKAGDAENARLCLEKALAAPDLQWQQQIELRLLQKEAALVVAGAERHETK